MESMRMIFLWILGGCAAIGHAAEVDGERRVFHPVEVSVRGPSAAEADEPSPFVRYELDAVFTHADGETVIRRPGFFAADGDAAETSADRGDVWRVRFTPTAAGRWTYRLTMTDGGDAIEIEDATGSFDVGPSDKTSPDFRASGVLTPGDGHYPVTTGTGRRWIKTGTNSPETMLGYADFDGTSWQGDHIVLPSLDDNLHRYRPHERDYRDGDPTWGGGRGRGLIGAVNYLADVGVNCHYFVTMNVGGDGRNVWPWTSPTDFTRFDVSKLDQWNVVFGHMQRLGVAMHVVLQETENDHLLDGGELGDDRRRYLRELVARFGHHPGLIWNLGEENTQTVDQQRAMSRHLRGLDDYGHPITIHNDHWRVTDLSEMYDALVGTGVVDGTSIQDLNYPDVHGHTVRYVEASRAAGRPWFVCCDELGGANFGTRNDADDPDHDTPRRSALWANLMGGGAGVEWYFGWQNNAPDSDLSAEDYRTRDAMYRQSAVARDIVSRWPLERMRPMDDATMDTRDYVLGAPGEFYAVYRPDGDRTRMDLSAVGGDVGPRAAYAVRWIDPKTGEVAGVGRDPIIGRLDHVFGDSHVPIGKPANDDGRDWLCVMKRVDAVFGPDDDGVTAVETERVDVEGPHQVLRKGSPPSDAPDIDRPNVWFRSNDSAATSASGKTYVRVRGGESAVLRCDVALSGDAVAYARTFHPDGGGGRVTIGDASADVPSGPGWRWVEVGPVSGGDEATSIAVRITGPAAVDKIALTPAGADPPTGTGPGPRLAPEVFAVAFDDPTAYPGDRWSHATPESVGVDGDAMREALSYLRSQCFDDGLNETLVVRHGRVIFDGGDTGNTHNIWSCSKSLTSTALGFLVAEGQCRLDQPASDFEPVLCDRYADATLRHFASMTSGYSAVGRSRWKDENSDWSWTPYEPDTPHFAPGTAYAYWDEAQMMLGRVLTRAAGEPLVDYLRPRLFDPIGMGPVRWDAEGEVDRMPINNGCTNIHVNADQFARFGLLMLRDGMWNGRRVLPRGWVKTATSVQVPESIPVGDTDRANVVGSGSYGLNWWLSSGRSGLPDAPAGSFYASGLNHNVLMVIPAWDMVIVRMGVDGNPTAGKPAVWNEFLKRLSEAM